MKTGLKTMQKEYKKLDIDKIESLQDEMEDMLDLNNEIQEAMARSYLTPDVCAHYDLLTDVLSVIERWRKYLSSVMFVECARVKWSDASCGLFQADFSFQW